MNGMFPVLFLRKFVLAVHKSNQCLYVNFVSSYVIASIYQSQGFGVDPVRILEYCHLRKGIALVFLSNLSLVHDSKSDHHSKGQ